MHVISLVIGVNLFTAEILGKKRYKTYAKICFLQKIILHTLAISLYYITNAKWSSIGITYLIFGIYM